MESFNLLQQTRTRFESPAKVFAKLKSKVQNEARIAKERNDPLFSIKENRGAVFHSPRKKSANMWTIDEPKENKRFSSNRNEAKALTLSPISSPQKPCNYPCKPLRETDTLRGYRRRNGAFLESTAMFQSLSAVNRDHISRTPQISDSNNFIMAMGSPVKTQPVENIGRGVFDKRVAHVNPVALNSVMSPMRNRLRKRKLDKQKFYNFRKTTEESIEDVCSPQETRQSPSTEDYTFSNSCMQGLDHVTEPPADQSERIREPMFPQSRFPLNQRCSVIVEKMPPMSPAKMFIYMKERESKRGKEVHNSSRRELFENLHQSIDTSLSAAHNMDEMEEVALNDSPEIVVPVNKYKEDSADKQLDAPILLEDPLVLTSPQVSIPKKDKAAFQRNHWRNQEKFPTDSVIYLKKWFLRRNQKGLFVDGIHGDDNIPWNSNIIVDRVSQSVLKTISGRVYVLVGKMNMYQASDFPKSFLKKFLYGFPLNWKTLYEKFLSESIDKNATKNKEKSIAAVTNSEASAIRSVKRQRQNSLRSPDPCTPASSTKVSRSGRVIKPPLEYWKGGRVTLDAQMNVTIHECYDICNSDTSSIASLGTSKKSVRVFLPNSEGFKKRGSAEEEEISLVRKVRALRNRNRAEVNRDEKANNSSQPTSEALKIPEERTYKASSSQRCPHTRGVPQKQSEPETQRSKKQTYDTNRPSVRTSRRKQNVTKSPESPPVTDESPSCPSSEEFPIKRRRREKEAHSKKDVKDSNKSQLDHHRSLSKSYGESREGLRSRSRRTRGSDEAETKPKESQRADLFPPAQPKRTQPSRKHRKGNTIIPQERDENEWTEVELIKLQEAVSFYPKNIHGFWNKVARMVGTRSAEDCHKQHTSKGMSQSPPKRADKHKKEKVEAPKPPVMERPVISARAGTLKRKQQVRQFLEALPRDDVDDAFSSTYMQNKRFEIPSTCLSDDNEFSLSNLEPQTPMSSCFPEAKTPQCLHITPGMIGSPNANGDDKFVYQLQKRMKKNQFNVCKAARSSMRFTPSAKRKIQGCGNTENDAFVVWEMFPANDGGLSESEEQEDFYFSDD